MHVTLEYGKNKRSMAIVLFVVFINELSWLGVEVTCHSLSIYLIYVIACIVRVYPWTTILTNSSRKLSILMVLILTGYHLSACIIIIVCNAGLYFAGCVIFDLFFGLKLRKTEELRNKGAKQRS
jgi:hypothetical protein